MKFLLTIFFLTLISIFESKGQELIRNGSFEDYHSTFDNHDKAEYAFNTLRDWDFTGWIGIDYINVKHENYIPVPLLGQGMVRLNSNQSCPFVEPYGCSPYLYQKLDTPLEIGKIYEVSFLSYIPSKDTSYYQLLDNVGVAFMVEEPNIHAHKLYDQESFYSDTLSFNRWCRTSFRFRALCNMKYVVIGQFRDEDFPCDLNMYPHQMFDIFIDDVSLKGIVEEDSKIDFSTPYCEYFERKKVQESLKSSFIDLYFMSSEFKINDKSKEELMHYFLRHKDSKVPVIIEAYTDSEGIDYDNYLLSEQRAKEIKRFLMGELNVAEHRIFLLSKGEKFANQNKINSNDRKVRIYFSPLKYEKLLYKELLNDLDSKNYEASFEKLRKWLQIVGKDERIYPVFDIRLDTMRHFSEWKNILHTIKNFYTSNNSFRWDSLYCEDQYHRTLCYDIAQLDSENIDSNYFLLDTKISWKQLHEIDSINAIEMKRLVKINGFPTIKKMGRRQAKAAAYIIDHVADTAMMKKYLPIIENYCKRGEAEWFSYAIIKDRLNILEDKNQIYGTQFDILSNGRICFPNLDNIDSTNILRQQIGLPKITISQ